MRPIASAETAIPSPVRRRSGAARGLLSLILACCPPLASAHEPGSTPVAHQCEQPRRPADSVPPAQWHAFLEAVDQFRDCTNRAMERHQQAAATHQSAAKAAVDEWNLFVRHSLNAPRDFPHESQQTRSRSRTDSGIDEVNGGFSGALPQHELRPQFEVEHERSVWREGRVRGD